MKYVGLPGLFFLIALLPATRSSSSKLELSAPVQNRETIQQLFGSPVREVYRASSNLTVAASFASNGNLCQTSIRPDVDSRITDKQLEAVLDKLAPKEARGKYEIGTFLNFTCMKLDSAQKPIVDPCAECSGTSEDYARVKITRYGNTNQYSSVEISFKNPECNKLHD
jgi:hypothetical protein